MRDHTNRIITLAVVSIFCLIGIACAIVVIAQLPYWGAKTPEWLAALGTISAFAGTIALATRESRRRRRDDLIRARLRATGILNRVIFVNQTVIELKARMRFSTIADESPEFLVGKGREITKVTIWNISEIEPLIPLPNNLAAMLAQASDELLIVQSGFLRGNSDGALAQLSERQDFSRWCYEVLSDTSETLDKCIVECMRAREHLNRPELD